MIGGAHVPDKVSVKSVKAHLYKYMSAVEKWGFCLKRMILTLFKTLQLENSEFRKERSVPESLPFGT